MATILRSSKYLRNFAEFATKIGFSHIKQDVHFSLLTQKRFAPSTLARSLATQIASKQLDHESNIETTLRMLDADVRRYGKISRSKLQRILNAFENTTSVTSTQALMIIRCCGNLVPDELPETRSELVNQVWKSLENSGIQLDLSHYNALLRVYIENEYAFSPAEILAELERKGIEPNKLTYQRLIHRYCQQGDIDGASKILEFMREKGVPVNESIFTALVKGHSEAGDMVSAADILSVMRQASLEPSADTYKELLCGYAKHGDIQSITDTLAECRSKGVHLLDTDFFDVIYSLACNGHSAHVATILSILPKQVGYLQDAMSHVLKLVHAGHTEVAKQVLSSIPNREKGNTGSTVIRQMTKANLPVATLLDLCKEIESRGINSRTLLIALESYLLRGHVEGSLTFLNALHESGTEIREHYFWPIFVALGQSNDNAGINDLLQNMRTVYNVPISGETLRDYVIPNKTGGPDKILAELLLINTSRAAISQAIVYNLICQMKIKEAADFGTKHMFHYYSGLFVRPLVAALAHTKDVTSFVEILGHIHRNRFRVEIVGNQKLEVDHEILKPYLVDLAAWIKDDEYATLTKVLSELLDSGHMISDNCIATLQQIVGNQATPELIQVFTRCKTRRPNHAPVTAMHLSSYHAEIAAISTSRDDLDGDEQAVIRNQKRLLYLYSRTKDLPNIEKTITKLKEKGVEFTDTICRQLLDAYVNIGALDKAEEYLSNLLQNNPGYIVDDSILIKYTTLLVKNERIDDAVQFVKEQASVRTKDNSKTRGVWWRVLNALADMGSVKAVHAVFDMLSQNEFLDISASNLGPLIKVHIVRDDLTEALKEFERMCETYKQTPLKNELSKRLIMTEDAIALQRLTDLSTQIHGEVNSLYELAISFIECDCLRQAKKILQIPALHAKSHKLLRIAQRYKDIGMATYLERIVLAIKDVPYFKAMPEFYEYLLHCYNEQNDYVKGLKLKQQMEDEEIEPSNAFLVMLADLLNRNNQPITFAVPESRSNNVSKYNQYTRSPINQNDDSNHDESNTKSLQVKRDSKLIESLLRNGQMNTALQTADSLLEKNLYPEHRTFRFLIRKAGQMGQIEYLERISENLSLTVKKAVNFENSLCHAYVVAEKPEIYFERLEKLVETHNDTGGDTIFEQFPMVGIRHILQTHPEFTERFKKFAEKLAAEGRLQPINALWIYYFLNENGEADKIWSEYLAKSPEIRLTSILRKAQKTKNPELLKRLVKTLDQSPLIDAYTKGQVYAALIELCCETGKSEESVDVLREALKTLSINNLPDNTLTQMKTYLVAQGVELPADIFPESQEMKVRDQMTT